ncbi:MAG TPA: energy transducer TonB [Ramlibacter sp.]|uniref:energy transducer TonB n=1 Tax=Ramlibacter sp. TaxID=1917967 RepID=UPI002D362620|nr:energy transducer TonB [Ramlibacter sp.]HZY19501.1 energy transducer TonB [Ramlibacter sp.]
MSWRTDPLAQPAFRLAVAAAIALHAGLLLGWPTAAAPAPPATGPGGGKLKLRHVPAPQAPAAAPLAPQPAAVGAVQAAKLPPASPPPAPSVPQDTAAPLAAPAAQPAGEPEYLPRSRLTVPPRPRDEVSIPFPDEVKGVVDLKVRVALFIDEAGTVQRVKLETADVPPVFAEAVQKAFLATRFSPGELDARPVRSQVRIEVAFGTGLPR